MTLLIPSHQCEVWSLFNVCIQAPLSTKGLGKHDTNPECSATQSQVEIVQNKSDGVGKKFELRTLFKIVYHQLPICSWRAKCFLHSLSSVEISCWKVPLNGTSLVWCLWAVSSYDSTFLASELFFNFCISFPQKKWWFQAFQVLKWYIGKILSIYTIKSQFKMWISTFNQGGLVKFFITSLH